MLHYLKVYLIYCCSVTVVHEYKVYWVRIPGPVVSLMGATATSAFTAAPVPTTTTSPALSTPVSVRGQTINNKLHQCFTQRPPV